MKAPKSLGDHFRKAFRESCRRRRPVSFYLMFAIVLALLLGTPMVRALDHPREFAFYLSMYFVFFFAVIYRAVLDCLEIARGHLREREQIYRATLGETGFVEELGKRVTDQRRKAMVASGDEGAIAG